MYGLNCERRIFDNILYEVESRHVRNSNVEVNDNNKECEGAIIEMKTQIEKHV
jgi:hypothetical protein